MKRHGKKVCDYCGQIGDLFLVYVVESQMEAEILGYRVEYEFHCRNPLCREVYIIRW